MPKPPVLVAILVAAALLLGAGAVVWVTRGADPEAAAHDFLSRYVDPDGRVVRHDQGGDTVSEGQAYALLVAAGTDDEERFRLVWTWTTEHLRRPDGLLSWRWADGAVVDPSAASDADLDAARALVIAGDRFDDPELTAAGVALGGAVLDHETVITGRGRVLVAGDWATTAPYAYNPSYASPAAYAVLGRASADPRWAELAAGSRDATAAVLAATALPPDWAQLTADGAPTPLAGPDGRSADGVRYAYDAARTPIRYAESCAADDVALAARLQVAFDQHHGYAAARELSGSPLGADESVLAAVGQAAAAAASGDRDAAGVALQTAADLQRAHPTYYGAAWSALGPLVLTTDRLGGCPPLG